MKINVSFLKLDEVRRSIKASLGGWRPQKSELSAFEKVSFDLVQGHELELKDIEIDRGFFTHAGKHVVLYIRDHGWKEDVFERPENANRVHLTDCRTLQQKRRNNSFERYVATNRRDDLYEISTKIPSTGREKVVTAKLLPCKNCLKKLNYRSYNNRGSEQRNIVEYFKLEEFFETYTTAFSTKPQYTDKTSPPNHYSDDWPEVSRRCREGAGWVCANCSVDLSQPQDRQWLHLHHINGIKGDNNPANLQPLCVLCHKACANHGHMKVNQVGAKRVRYLRKEQGSYQSKRNTVSTVNKTSTTKISQSPRKKQDSLMLSPEEAQRAFMLAVEKKLVSPKNSNALAKLIRGDRDLSKSDKNALKTLLARLDQQK